MLEIRWMKWLLALGLALGFSVLGCASKRPPETVAADPGTMETIDQAEVRYHRNGLTYFKVEKAADTRTGVAKMFFSSGLPLYCLEFRDGVPDGDYRRWHFNGFLRERGQFTAGQPSGVWEVYDGNGARRGHGHLGEPRFMAGSFDLSDSSNPVSLGLPTADCYEKGEDWKYD
ncbi:MAG: hypothetical protein H6839_17895 [Planctomycetes bacterium]|nr:hypothetical protein [Planctomycetota bacterium]